MPLSGIVLKSKIKSRLSSKVAIANVIQYVTLDRKQVDQCGFA